MWLAVPPLLLLLYALVHGRCSSVAQSGPPQPLGLGCVRCGEMEWILTSSKLYLRLLFGPGRRRSNYQRRQNGINAPHGTACSAIASRLQEACVLRFHSPTGQSHSPVSALQTPIPLQSLRQRWVFCGGAASGQGCCE
jgi:hypothetical protein